MKSKPQCYFHRILKTRVALGTVNNAEVGSLSYRGLGREGLQNDRREEEKSATAEILRALTWEQFPLSLVRVTCE